MFSNTKRTIKIVKKIRSNRAKNKARMNRIRQNEILMMNAVNDAFANLKK